MKKQDKIKELEKRIKELEENYKDVQEKKSYVEREERAFKRIILRSKKELRELKKN